MTDATLDTIRRGQFELQVSDKTPKLTGLLILAVTFGLFGTWSFIAPLDSASLAPGQVTVKNYRKTVQHLEGGIVADLLVSDGDRVLEGQPLIVLDDTQLKAELGITQGKLIALETTKARLEAERDLKRSIQFPDLLQQSYSGDPRLTDAMQNETSVFTARTNSRDGEVAVLTQRLEQVNEEISASRARIDSRSRLVASYTSEISDLRALLTDGYVDIQRIRELERQVAQVESEVNDLKSAIAQARVRYSEVELQILQLTKNFQTEVVDQLRQVETQLFDLKEREMAIKSRFARSTIRAPESGMVLGLTAHTIGGVIRPGEPILEIVPDSSELIIEAQVSPMDIDRISLDQEADIRFSAFKSATTPVIKGIVKNLSPDRLVNRDTGVPYYLAKIEIPQDELDRLGDLQLLPGMPAEVLIKTGERTLFEYLAAPATNAFARSLIED